MRRTPEERIADHEAKAAKLKADAERRLAVASDQICSWLWDAECALNRVRLSTTEEPLREYAEKAVLAAKTWREERWAGMRTP